MPQDNSRSSITPAERVRLNAAILRSVQTGQPLSPELQSLYQSAKNTQNTLFSETQTPVLSFPTRNKSDLIRDPNAKNITDRYERVRHSGPASDLPTTDFEELYPRRSQFPVPFTREIEGDISPRNIQNELSVKDRAQRFLDQYFPGEKVGQVVVKNPATNRPYGNELTIHDAMHDFANVGNTLRGEELITIAEKINATPLASKEVGLSGLTQQLGKGNNIETMYNNAIEDVLSQTRLGGRPLVQQRGAARGSSLFRDQNRVESFLSPPISKEEFNTMAQRGQEFYDQVHANWNAFRKGGGVEWSDLSTRSGERIRKNAVNQFLGNSENNYGPPRAITQRIAGGYNTGGIPYGNPLSLMNAPLVPTVDSKLWMNEIRNLSEKGIPALKSVIEQEETKYKSPEQQSLRQAPKDWELKANALQAQAGGEFPMTVFQDLYREKGLDTTTPEFQRTARIYNALMQASINKNNRKTVDILEDTLGPKPFIENDSKIVPISMHTNRVTGSFDSPDNPDFFENTKEPSSLRFAIESALDNITNSQGRGITAGAASDFRGGGRIYLNPANLGANVKGKNWYQIEEQILNSAGINPKDALLEIAAAAKQKEGYNKAFPLIKKAIGTGFNATTDLAGSVPLFDPEFRQAVEKGNLRKAATQVAKEYAIGTAAAPVVGAGMGVLQRVAPQAARVATGALGVARTANPIAVTSQLGGSSVINRKADEAAGRAQLQRAEAARRRGGRWKFPTPFGSITVPELGISEAGGLFFR